MSAEEVEVASRTKEALLQMTRSEILHMYPFLPKVTKTKAIEMLTSKPVPSDSTKEKVEKLIISLNKQNREELKTILSTYLWWKDGDLQKKILTYTVDKAPPPIVRKSTTLTIKNTEERQKKNAIKFADLRKEARNPSFISKLVGSLKILYQYKIDTYQKILKEINARYSYLQIKVKRLEDAGIGFDSIKELYPSYISLLSYIISVEEIVKQVNAERKNLSEKKIKENLNDVIKKIASLVGRDEIKDVLATQIYSLAFNCFSFTVQFNNIRIYGQPGIGKTMLAEIIGYVFTKIGVLVKGDVRCTTRANFIGSYIGQTAPRTIDVLMETLECVLFIDEAYQLAMRTGTNDFGDEAITEIVNFTDKYIGLSIIIVAGYQDKMEEYFMPSNKGLYRRFPYLYILTPYSVIELSSILVGKLTTMVPFMIKIDGPTTNFLTSVIRITEKYLKDQAGDMLNLASCISRSIGAAYNVKWKNGALENNKIILLEGINEFLAIKGISLNINTAVDTR